MQSGESELATKIAKSRANVLDCVRFGDDGAPIVDLSQLDRDQAAGLSELTIEEIAAGSRGRPAIKRTRFRLHDKLAALDKLARHFGLLREPAPAEPVPAAPEPAAPPAPQHSTRQVARAVLAILETAELEDEDEETEMEMETGLSYFDRTPFRSSSPGTMS